MDTPTETLSSACTLQGDELAERIRAWRNVVSRATERRVVDGRAIAVYPHDRQLLEQLRGLIRSEASCCSFVEFTLEEEEDGIVTKLRLPEELPAPIKAMIFDLMG